MLRMYEAITITKILMHFWRQKDINASRLYYFLPPARKRFNYDANNNMYYVESMAEHKKASPSIHKQCAGTIR